MNRYVLGSLVIGALIGGAYYKGYSSASLRCHDGELRAQIATMQRDMAAWRAADEVERMLQADLARDNADLQQKVTDYETDLATRPNPGCALSPADADRLRGIGRR
jgi:hypothetical protein